MGPSASAASAATHADVTALAGVGGGASPGSLVTDNLSTAWGRVREGINHWKCLERVLMEVFHLQVVLWFSYGL